MIKNHTKTDNWSAEDLVNAITDSSNKNRILIPKFQRTLVWKPNQKKEFIDSIKKGFPIGALLLYKTKSEGNTTFYTLIDGLQRSTTLKQYSEAPTSELFFDNTNIEDSTIIDLKNLVGDTVEIEDLKECVVKWITSLKGFEESKGFSSFDLSDHLNEVLKLEKDLAGVKEVTKKLVPYLENIKDDSNISSFEIPILIYSGPEENLPVIFERLNSRGTQLNKYQIYAAAWQHYELFTISNTDIIDKIKKKYESLIEEGYEIENYDGSKKFYTTRFSKFEYLFGVGKLLADKYIYLFSNNSKSEQEDSIGFNITNICLGKPFSEMNLLPKYLGEYKLEEFEKCIFNSIEFINDCLKGQISLKMSATKRISIVHTEMQIVSMIGKAFHSRYDSKLKEKDTWKESKIKLKKNIKFHYLYDILKEAWKGSGDTRAYSLISSDRYENEISKKQWENLFEEWLENDLLKKEKIRVNIKDSSILFYKYLYTHTLSAYEELSDKSFDIEHLVPVGRLKDLTNDIGLPISAFPNLCLLDSTLNRKKGDETYYEHYNKLIDKEEKTKEQAEIELKHIEGYSFTDKTDLNFVTTDFTSENYITFLKNRFKLITEKFYDYYEIK